MKAVTIKNFSYYYDFLEDEEFNPLLDNGSFPVENPIIEHQIYEQAAQFTFKDPKQLVKLLRKEEMKRLRVNDSKQDLF